MEENKILIIEDQRESIESAFAFANAIGFQDRLDFTYVPRSQDIDFENLSNTYDLIFVDITLAERSQMNGFGIIRHILEHDHFPQERIVILTGNSKIAEGLRQNGIPENIETVYKPVTFRQLIPIIQRLLS